MPTDNRGQDTPPISRLESLFMSETEARATLERLIEGNKRFRSGQTTPQPWHEAHSRPQNPRAIILGCSDSRVPVEMIFDQGPGDLFVIRVAGNIVAPSQVGSVEFAVEQFNVPLVLVLGHSNCGAIDATMAQIKSTELDPLGHLGAIVDRIAPSIQDLMEGADHLDKDELVHRCMRANVRASVNQLRHGSRLLETRLEAQTLMVLGAEYELATGEVNLI